MKSICIYCGSSDNVAPIYLETARQTGREIAKRGIQLIYGGGQSGLMGAVASAAMEAGGEVIGIIPEFFVTPAVEQNPLTRLEIVVDMHERKARMADLVDGFIALPGGFGTMEEFFETLTWSQIGLHQKPIGLLNINGYYDSLLEFLKQISQKGFTYGDHLDGYLTAADVDTLLISILNHQPPDSNVKWLKKTE
jgi:uncharacterized protein (TIGR00730 family)